MTVKDKTKKIISALLIILVLVPTVLFSRPKKAEAFIPDFLNAALKIIGNVFEGASAYANQAGIALKFKEVAKEALKEVAKRFARKLLQQITQNTINWINTGFHGNPLFIENPKSFFKDIAKLEVKNLIKIFGYDSRRFPFGKDFSLNIIASYKRTLENNAQYSLSKVINDPSLLASYRNNFNVGGWNGFLINTQYPQNNYIGFQMLATEELARRIANPVDNKIKKTQELLQQGMGFLSPQTCPSNPDYPIAINPNDPPSFKQTPWDPPKPVFIEDPEQPGSQIEDPASIGKREQYEQNYITTNTVNMENFDKKYDCPKGLVNTTPGGVVANQINQAMGSKFRETELAGAIGGSISAILDALLNHFIDKGLNALLTKRNPPPDNPDNWDYYGNTLGSPSDDPNSPWNAGPDEEIDLNKVKKQIDGKTIVTITDADGAETTTEEIGNTVATTGGEYIPGDIAST